MTLARRIDPRWGELRSAAHAPSRESWERLTTLLLEAGAQEREFTAYIAPLLSRWPASIVRPVPDMALSQIAQGGEVPGWLTCCNALEIVPRHGVARHVPGMELTRQGTGGVATTLDRLAPHTWHRLHLERVGLHVHNISSLLDFLESQRELRALALCYNSLGGEAFERIEQLGVFRRLEQLWLDGNQIGRRALHRLFSPTARWSEVPVREFSWSGARLSQGALARARCTPWFGEVERLQLIESVMGHEALERWLEQDGPSALRELGISLDLELAQLKAFSRLEALSGLERLEVCEPITASYLSRRRVYESLPLDQWLYDASWRDTLRVLSLDLRLRGVRGLGAIDEEGFPPQLEQLWLTCERSHLEIRAYFERWGARFPHVRLVCNEQEWRRDERGVWSWRAVCRDRPQWWRHVDRGHGWR